MTNIHHGKNSNFFISITRKYKMFGLVYEDPMGEFLPNQMGKWTATRKIMTDNGWKDGKLLNHIHQKWDFATASTLACLENGGDGVWAGLCIEGAAVGHACSCVTILNLIRFGNKYVLNNYNCTEFRNAAIEVTKITTGGVEPFNKQPVYGSRATDLVFSFIGFGDFDVGKFFGIKTENRITTLASTQMIIED